MKTLLLAVAILIAVPTLSQVEHAPTVAQCQADQRLWFSKLEGPESNLDDTTIITLNDWSKEMVQCEAVDPENRFKYGNTSAESVAEKSIREMHFINRHGLYDQFIAEDAAGKR
jgi:hypothetical protein